MQSKRNRILINATLTLITLILSVLVSLNSTKSYLEALNQTIFSTQTVSILVVFGTSINFIITLLINFNVYKVLYKISSLDISAIDLYFDLMLSMIVSNILLLLNTHGSTTEPLVLFLLNCLSYFIFIVITLIKGYKNKINKVSLLKLCGLLLLFTIVINSFSFLSNINSIDSLQ